MALKRGVEAADALYRSFKKVLNWWQTWLQKFLIGGKIGRQEIIFGHKSNAT